MYSITYLARQGIAHRGNNLNQGNLYEIMKMQSRNKPEIIKMINRVNEATKLNIYLVPIQNEICTMYGHSILRIIAEEVKKGPFSIMCDGTQYITLEYQESIVIRFIDENLKVQEKFI